jgi:hypothetical protein
MAGAGELGYGLAGSGEKPDITLCVRRLRR